MEIPAALDCPFCHATTGDFLEVVDDAEPEKPWVPLVDKPQTPPPEPPPVKKRKHRPRWMLYHRWNGCRMGPRTWDLAFWNKR
jgi:hypothetical protein